MGIFYDAPVDPVDLTTFVRRVPTPDSLTLTGMFGTTVRDTTKVAFSEITRTNRTARFRAPDGRIHVADRDGGSDRVVNMLPLSDSRNQGEYETLQLEMARLGGTRTEALANAIYNDAEDLTRYIQNRIELALGDVLTDGKFTPDLSDELTGVEVDFGMPSDHQITLLTDQTWTDANVDTADMLDALQTACDVYEETNGERPGWVMTSRKNIRALERQTLLINAVYGATQGRTSVPMPEILSTLDSRGIPTDWRINETKLDVDGTATRVISEDLLILGPSNPSDLLEFRLGMTATALELVGSNAVDLSFSQAPGLTGVVVKEGPPIRRFTYVDAIGIPLLKSAKKLMTVKVR